MNAPTRPSVVDRTAFLRVLAVYKFVQTAILVALGLATVRLVRPEVAAAFEQWVQDLPVGYVQHVSERFLGWISGPQTHRVLILGGALFAYSALFLVEAVGLWLQRRWAEWLTVVATGLLIPPEVYECFMHPSTTLFVLLFVNVTVVWLLAKRLQHELAGTIPTGRAPAP
ncbi:MAG: DUF2127 domain-containing protein [Gemmatimonadaceae bacterium]|nr:DUF2127 domain-containing protein [Gemmatimonadaceae bacterium]